MFLCRSRMTASVVFGWSGPQCVCRQHAPFELAEPVSCDIELIA